MGQTITEKILSNHAGAESVKPGDIVTIEPDRVMSHDNTAFIVKKFQKTTIERVWNKEKIVIVFDHCIPAQNPAHQQNHDEAKTFAEAQGLTNFLGPAGVCHQVMMEKGFALPGQIVLGADSHSTLYGAMNCLGIPINRTEMAGVWATGKTWLKVPETIKVNLSGKLKKGVFAKDVILELLRVLKSDGATYKALEFSGETIKEFSMSERMTLSNMAVELGAKAGVMECDDKTRAYLNDRTSEKINAVKADDDAEYCQEVDLNVGDLEPLIACPHSVDNVKKVKDVQGLKVDHAYLGSCTNGRLDDLEVAAGILDGEKVSEGVELVVYPASYEVYAKADELGYLDVFRNAGGKVMTASCGPCFGAVGAVLKDDEVSISSSNRNFCGRMGSNKSFVYLASPATVAASCIEGMIASPSRYS